MRRFRLRSKITDLFALLAVSVLSDFAKEEPWRPPSLLLEVDPPLHDRTRALMNRIVSLSATQGATADVDHSCRGSGRAVGGGTAI